MQYWIEIVSHPTYTTILVVLAAAVVIGAVLEALEII